MKCGGCEKEATTFQCPLCQAQDSTDTGFYCSQECFAKQWLTHRDEFHKSGVVREKTVLEKEQLRVAREDAGKEKKTKKRLREGEGEGETDGSTAANGTAAQPEGDATATPAAAETVHLDPWQPIPVPATCAEQGLAQVTPQLPVDCPKAVVEVKTNSLSEALWPSATAAAHYVQRCLHPSAAAASSSSSSKGKKHKDAPKILIISGTNQSAHACAWACRSAGLASKLRMVLSTADEDVTGDPSTYFTAQYPIVITSATLLQHAGKKTAGSTSLWLTGDNCLLITLPDVPLAEDYQTLSSRALFFNMVSAESEAAHEKKKTAVSGKKNKSNSSSDASFTLSTFGKGIKGKDGKTTPFNLWSPFSDVFIGTRFDNDVSTCFARGDLPGALHHLIRLFGSSSRNRCEEVLRNTLMADWGSSNVVVAHHRLAYTLRFLVDRSEKFSGTNASKDTLQDVALRAICRVASFLPPLVDTSASASTDANAKKPKKSRRVQNAPQVESSEDAARIASGLKPRSEATTLELDVFKNYFSSLPNLQLQATLCYIFPGTAAGFIDRLATAWGIKRVIAGPKVLAPLNRGVRRDACERVQKRYSAKLDSKQADYYVVLMHFIYDAVGKYSLPLEVVAQRTQWSVVSEHDVGPLTGFLQDCFLLPQVKTETAKPKAGASVPATLSSRKSAESTAAAIREREAAYCAFPVKPCSPRLFADVDASKTDKSAPRPTQTPTVALTYTELPLTGARQRQVEQLRNVAIEEILMAMPRKPTPMYIGDVGNLIGSWFRFNARYDGALGTNLGEFLLQNPQHFRVVANVVTRCKAGSSDQVRIRFDDDDEHGDDSDDSDNEARKRKNRDRRLLTGAKKGEKGETVHHSSRARKKAVIKQFNKERFNKNHKKFDKSAKVPGYIKHGPRKVKGRGRKINKRNSKRAV